MSFQHIAEFVDCRVPTVFVVEPIFRYQRNEVVLYDAFGSVEVKEIFIAVIAVDRLDQVAVPDQEVLAERVAAKASSLWAPRLAYHEYLSSWINFELSAGSLSHWKMPNL